jgi:CheY-like chemotaxis protein
VHGTDKAVKRVLIVEDDDRLREALQELLTASGYETISAEDGIEALDWLARLPMDLIIVDLLMPRMGGHQLIKRIRESVEWATTPILLLSGYADVASYRRLPVDSVLLKPFRLPDLLEKVQEMIGSGGGSADDAGASAASPDDAL